MDEDMMMAANSDRVQPIYDEETEESKKSTKAMDE